MRTFTTKPSVLVTVNNITSVCLSGCEFTYIDEAPQISFLFMNTQQIYINISKQVLNSNSKV